MTHVWGRAPPIAPVVVVVVATVLSFSFLLSHLRRALWLLLLLERGDLHVEVVVGGCWLREASFPHGSTNWRAIEVEGPGAVALGQREEVFLSVADVVVDARHLRRRERRFFPRSPCGRRRLCPGRRRRGARSSSSRGRRGSAFFFSSRSRNRRLAARAGQQGGEALHWLFFFLKWKTFWAKFP